MDILSQKISDQRFLNLLKDRLHLRLLDVKSEEYVHSFTGIPQGGIDSPYLFNIFLLGLDEFSLKRMTELIDVQNKIRMGNRINIPVNTLYKKIKNFITKLFKIFSKFSDGLGGVVASYFCFAKEENNKPVTLKKSWSLLSPSQAKDLAVHGRNIKISKKLLSIKRAISFYFSRKITYALQESWMKIA